MASVVRRLRRLGGDRGSELIELAIVTPILLFIIAGIMDFGFLFQRYEVVTNAAREGARLGSLPGYTAADIQARVDAYLASSGLTAAHPTPDVQYSTQTVGAGGPTINVVTVTVLYHSPFDIIGPFAGMVGGGGWTSITLRSSSVMRLEAPAGGGS
jgi:Flp pilus assembly protein TadG